MTTLGSLSHTARIDEAGTGRPIWQSTPQTLYSVGWGREYCETSAAKITINAPRAVREIVEPWRHLLSIYAGEELVWHGPIMRMRARRESVEISASDPSRWWGRRRVAQARHYLNKDASQVARDLVTDAMGADDPSRVVTYMRVENSGVWTTMDLTPATRMVADEMSDLVSAGLVWTVAAGRLLVGPLPSGYQTNILTDDHWDADISVVKDGAEVVTDLLVQGSGVYGYHIDEDRTVGWLQGIQSADGLVRAEECEQLARRRVEEAKYPPRRMEFDGGGRLLPSAPVSISELVPGVLIPVSSSQTGVTVSSVMALRSVSVEEDADGDRVQITLMERPAALDPLLAPKMVTEDYNSPYDREKRDKEQQMPRNDSSFGTQEGTGQAPVV